MNDIEIPDCSLCGTQNAGLGYIELNTHAKSYGGSLEARACYECRLAIYKAVESRLSDKDFIYFLKEMIQNHNEFQRIIREKR